MDKRQEEQQEDEPTSTTDESDTSETVLLKDLAPRQDVKGGAGKLRFGESKTPEIRDDS